MMMSDDAVDFRLDKATRWIPSNQSRVGAKCVFCEL